MEWHASEFKNVISGSRIEVVEEEGVEGVMYKTSNSQEAKTGSQIVNV